MRTVWLLWILNVIDCRRQNLIHQCLQKNSLIKRLCQICDELLHSINLLLIKFQHLIIFIRSFLMEFFFFCDRNYSNSTQNYTNCESAIMKKDLNLLKRFSYTIIFNIRIKWNPRKISNLPAIEEWELSTIWTRESFVINSLRWLGSIAFDQIYRLD